MFWSRLRAVIAPGTFTLLNLFAAVPGEIDRSCWKSPVAGSAENVCQILTVDRDMVTFIEPLRTIKLDRYVSVAQRFVPRTEAPIRDLRSPQGWRIVVSSFLNHAEKSAMLRVRFFDPDSHLRGKADLAMALEDIEVGRLFGGSDEIVAVQSNEEHSYNSQTDIWLLARQGAPRRLLTINATISKFSTGSNGAPPGVAIHRQTYDGIHAETKGWAEEFWVWDSANKSLTVQNK